MQTRAQAGVIEIGDAFATTMRTHEASEQIELS